MNIRRINRYIPILDQIAFPLCNFFLFSIITKNFSESEVSSYVYVYSIYLLVANILIGIIFDPAPFFWKTTTDRLKEKYILNLIFWFVVLSIFLSIVFLFLIAYINPNKSVNLGFQLICFFFISTLHIFLRRICFVSNKLNNSLISALLFALCLISTHLFEKYLPQIGIYDFISIINIIPAMYLLLSIILGGKLYLSLNKNTLDAKILLDHYKLGRWNIFYSTFSWYPANAHILLLKNFHNSADVAGMRVILNLLMPISQVISVISVVFLKESEVNNSNTKLLLKTILLNIFLAIIYIFIILFFGKQILSSLFGPNYIKLYPYLVIISLSSIPFAVTSCFINYYKYIGRSRLVANNSLIMLPFSLVISLFMISRFGFAGAVAYTVAFDVLLALVLTVGYLKKTRFV